VLRRREDRPPTGKIITQTEREITMADQDADKGKGHLKEAAGSVTGDKHVKDVRRRDQAKGSAKKAVETITDTLPGRGTE
jgi:uncharacterized protein YjbJ (UPF0337 family)